MSTNNLSNSIGLPRMANVASKVVYLNKFSGLSKDELDKKISENKQNQFWRYITKHKGRSFIILLSIIILILCFTFSIPTNGDQDTSSTFNHIASILGFFASNIFLCLLITIIGVETYFSREELEQLKIELENKTKNDIQTVKEIIKNESIKNNNDKINTILLNLTKAVQDIVPDKSKLQKSKINKIIVSQNPSISRNSPRTGSNGKLNTSRSNIPSERSENLETSTLDDQLIAIDELEEIILNLDMKSQIKLLKKISKILE